MKQKKLYDKRLGKLHDVISLMDKNIRSTVLKLNLSGFITFTSCEGHSSTELPRYGIICKDLQYACNLIYFIESLHKNIWYELSNRWIADSKKDESEINVSDEKNISDVSRALGLKFEHIYFLTIKAKTLPELKDFTSELLEWKEKSKF